MRTSLLAAFRTEDGRSLGWALAVLLLVNVLALGLSAGTMAAETSLGTSLCAAAAGDDGGPGIPHHHDCDCCLTGCAAAA